MGFAPDVIDPPPPFLMRCESEYEKVRQRTWYSKEPETIAWIDSFADGDTFWDIGANIGVYSLYCATEHPRSAVLACEPDRKNFAALCRNANMNLCGLHITPLQFAISDTDGDGVFYEAGATTGESGGQLNAALCNGMAAYPVRVRSIDSLVAEYGCPTHIKIDIDGQELKVVNGMRDTLKNPMLRSVLMEIETKTIEGRALMAAFFGAAGFTLDNRFNSMLPHSRTRRAAQWIRVENVIFTRER